MGNQMGIFKKSKQRLPLGGANNQRSREKNELSEVKSSRKKKEFSEVKSSRKDISKEDMQVFYYTNEQLK